MAHACHYPCVARLPTNPRRKKPAAPARAPLEKEIQSAIRDMLRAYGFRCERLNSGATQAVYKGKARFFRYGFEGCPDLIALLNDGRVLFVECKRPNGKLTMAQEEFRNECRRRGVPWCLGTSPEIVRAYLAQIGAI